MIGEILGEWISVATVVIAILVVAMFSLINLSKRTKIINGQTFFIGHTVNLAILIFIIGLAIIVTNKEVLFIDEVAYPYPCQYKFAGLIYDSSGLLTHNVCAICLLTILITLYCLEYRLFLSEVLLIYLAYVTIFFC